VSRLPDLPPGAGAAVMSLGILSVCTAQDGLGLASLALLVLAGAGWLGLAALFLHRLARDRPRFRADARTPGALTAVAATAVLGGRVLTLGGGVVAGVLLALCTVLWLGLLPLALAHLPRRTAGTHFLLTVSTQAPAGLAAALSAGAWLTGAAAALAALGLGLYAVVLSRFDRSELRAGAGDQWVAGGALAISSLTLSRLADAGLAPAALRNGALALWVAAAGWYLVLAAAELRWPRVRYATARWATVFPLGMLAAAAFALRGEPWAGTTVAGEVLVWPALAVGAVVAAGALRRLAPLL
jgi:Voltage-dependent anion channel